MDFKPAFEVLTGCAPFRWQERLFNDHFSKGEIPAALDLPTGLGKTSVMAIWLIARAVVDEQARRRLPRRLVYVVDRRAVVDQATAEAEKLRKALDGEALDLKVGLGLGDRSLPISTLRGQFVDNRDWLADPAASAIVVGTVDMIGSRLLFEGYGVSRKMRPYHAGMLGADALVVLDEAHLVPPFEKLLEAIEKGVAADYAENRQGALGPKAAEDRRLVPPFKLLSLSATGREREGAPFLLKGDDHNDDIVKRRLTAKKAISVEALKENVKLEAALADAAWKLSDDGANAIRCLIYCDKRETAQKVFDNLLTLAAPAKKAAASKAEVELFTGARRFFEREESTGRLLKPLGFIAGNRNETGKPVFVVATSAAEVGVDLDADRMVCDLVAWERMVQRLGRVNRRGDGDAKIIVIDAGEPIPKKVDEPTDAEKRTLLAYKSLAVIEKLRATEDGAKNDGSPAALLDLKLRAKSDAALQSLIDAATTPAPLRPALTRALVDAWSMTSLDKHTGRPEVAPWLRGWIDEDGPQTAIVWRTHLPVRTKGGDATYTEIEAFFEAAPPHVSEKLETETWAVVDWLIKRTADLSKAKKLVSEIEDESGAGLEEALLPAGDSDAPKEPPARPLKSDDIIAFTLSPARELKKTLKLKDFSDKEKKEALQKELAGVTLVIDARFGGLSGGLLDEKASDGVRTADDGGEWLPFGQDGEPLIKFRARPSKDQESDAEPDDGQTADSEDQNWHKPFKFHTELDDDGKPIRSLIVEKWRGASTSENEKSISKHAQSLSEHQDWTETRATAIAKSVGLEGDHANVLAIAARLHDEGKARELWQRAMGKPKPPRDSIDPDWPYAKTEGRGVNLRLLQVNGETFRHEFASINEAEKKNAPGNLSIELRDLALHLIAAHHGFARPVIAAVDPDAPPSALQKRARDVALRFARLQKQWGPWGLAWWEALLRAADQQASRENDEAGRKKPKSDLGSA